MCLQIEKLSYICVSCFVRLIIFPRVFEQRTKAHARSGRVKGVRVDLEGADGLQLEFLTYTIDGVSPQSNSLGPAHGPVHSYLGVNHRDLHRSAAMVPSASQVSPISCWYLLILRPAVAAAERFAYRTSCACTSGSSPSSQISSRP